MTARYSPHPGAKRSQQAYDAQRTVATRHFERTQPESLANHTAPAKERYTPEEMKRIQPEMPGDWYRMSPDVQAHYWGEAADRLGIERPRRPGAPYPR